MEFLFEECPLCGKVLSYNKLIDVNNRIHFESMYCNHCEEFSEEVNRELNQRDITIGRWKGVFRINLTDKESDVIRKQIKMLAE